MQPNEHPIIYQICVEGHLDEHWLRWFESVQITLLPDGVTEISGVMDQAALHGLLNRIRDLGMTLISVQRYRPEEDAPKFD